MGIRELDIRDLIVESFNPNDLRDFCRKYLPEIMCEFAEGASIKQMAMTVVEYCAYRERLSFLLSKLQAERPGKYKEHRRQWDWVDGQALSETLPAASGRGLTGADATPDIYAPYEMGMEQLLRRLGAAHPRYSEALVYQQRLFDNLARARRYGETPSDQAGRAAIVDQLNRLATACLGMSFSSLCGLV